MFAVLPNTKPKWRPKASTYSSWRVGVLGCTIAVFMVLVINVVITVSTVRTNKVESGTGGINDGTGVMFSGSCDKAEKLNTWIHLVINILSTIILSSTNYCVQVINAPTRSQVDKAHSISKKVDIGVMKLRNLQWIGWKKAVLWVILSFLSSIPLHLFWNSVVFGSSVAYTYTIQRAYEGYSNPLPKVGTFRKLNNTECVASYTSRLVYDRGDLTLIMKIPENDSIHNNFTGTSKIFEDIGYVLENDLEELFAWICKA